MNMTKLEKDNRKIKVSRRYVRSTWKEYRVPKIILSGKYLKEAGFCIGDDAIIHISNKIITITTL